MPRNRDEDEEEFEREYSRIPGRVWKNMRRAARGDVRRERARDGRIARDDLKQTWREQEHRRGHGKHDREVDGKRKREM